MITADHHGDEVSILRDIATGYHDQSLSHGLSFGFDDTIYIHALVDHTVTGVPDSHNVSSLLQRKELDQYTADRQVDLCLVTTPFQTVLDSMSAT